MPIVAGGGAGLSSEQVRNAQTIIAIGKSLGASRRDIGVALIAAMQESSLRNLRHGDRDSVGLFQQRNAWGSFDARTDPRQSARMFFLGGGQGQRGLLDFTNRNQMSMSEAAQSVQVSAYPDAYADHYDVASNLLNANFTATDAATGGVPDNGVLGVAPGATQTITREGTEGFDPATPGEGEVPQGEEIIATEESDPRLSAQLDPRLVAQEDPRVAAQQFDIDEAATVQQDMSWLDDMRFPGLDEYTSEIPLEGAEAIYAGDSAATGWRKKVIEAAQRALGTPYVWGGNSLVNGVDCSGLIQQAFLKAGINLPRISAAQAQAGARIGFDQLKPGDLVAIDNSSRNNGADHIGLFLGNGQVIHAPRPGSAVQVGGLEDVFGGGWGVRMGGR